MTRLGLIRHGSTAWNKEGRAQGTSDIPLNEEGRRQAEKLAKRLSHEEWDVIYSSDLQRAQETAEWIAYHSKGLTLKLDRRLREVDGGKIEGTTEEERIKAWGETWRDEELGVEKRASVIARGLSIIEEIHKHHGNQNILIVSHGSFLRKLLSELAPDQPSELSLDNTSLSKVCFRDEKWCIDLYNCIEHL
ncbi:histidine phosphatase family protein [Thalassobacillus sp. CUG 92003]|uniref:histidine phosphatase family protein n=1 Tax=Thalassobacillus sp. CUG 92003 TaxID=2736641 RepID=UPI0015E6408C|nr:histidine phosphatase family protein [Thalassobacillus sp. CUG 92003]